MIHCDGSPIQHYIIYEALYHLGSRQQRQRRKPFQGRRAVPPQGNEPRRLFRFHTFFLREDGDDETFAKDGDYEDGDYGDYDDGDDGDDGDYEDATLQQRASRGPAPIQVIITRRPRPKVSYVSLLKDNNSQPQESKV